MSVFVAVQLEGVLQQLERLADESRVSEAKKLQYTLDSLSDQLKSFILQHGCTLHLSTPSRLLFELDEKTAEQLPNILQDYFQKMQKVAVGIGMSPFEANDAAEKSRHTQQIEMYDVNEFAKTLDIEDAVFETHNKINTNPQINIFGDTEAPKPVNKPVQEKAPPELTPEESQKISQDAVQLLIQSMGGMPQPPPAPPQQPQAAPESEQGQLEPQQAESELVPEEAESEPVPGEENEHHITIPQPANQEPEQKDELLPEDKTLPYKDQIDGEEEITPQAEDKIFDTLARLKEEIPQIMQMKASDPEGFRDALKLIHTLMSMAKVKKTEQQEAQFEELAKRLSTKISHVPRGMPIGTIHARKKKVLVNGRAVWRSIAAGQTMDSHGQPISVKSHNNAAEQGIQKAQDRLQEQLTPVPGVSDIGIEARRGTPRNKEYARVYKDPSKHMDRAKAAHKELLTHLRNMKKPNLPKSELKKKDLKSLNKGSLQQKIPFNPVKDLPSGGQAEHIHNWQGSARFRHRIGQDTGNARARFLHKLSAIAPTRRSKNGGREFLLHRGHSSNEPQTERENTVSSEQKTSWTPKYDIAQGFAGQEGQSGGKVTSAWIHENNILTVPKQFGNALSGARVRHENPFSHEYEVIVGPHTSEKAQYTHTPLTQPKSNLNERITQRGKRGYAHFDSPAAVVSRKRETNKSEDLDKDAAKVRTPGLKGVDTRPDTQVIVARKPSDRRKLIPKILQNKAVQITDPEKRQAAAASTKKLVDKILRPFSTPSGNLYGAQISLSNKEGKKVSTTIARPHKELESDPTKQHKALQSTIEHEATHRLFDDIGQKHGQDFKNKLVSHLQSKIHPEVQKYLKLYLMDHYKSSHPGFPEEIINHARDLLTNEHAREVFNHNLKTKYGVADAYKKIEPQLKSSWKELTQTARKIKPDSF